MVLAAVLGGCGGNEVMRPAVTVSVGQQLIDLKKARDAGALTESQYESQKTTLIRSVQ
jgi:hypothetical protein